jgi:hypothetical protein
VKRRLPNLFTTLSLLACAAVCVVWVLSYRSKSVLEWWSPGAGAYEFRVHGAFARAGVVGGYFAAYPPGRPRGVYELHHHVSRARGSYTERTGALGFAVARSSPGEGVVWREGRVPCWFLLLVFGAVPLLRASRALAATRSRRRGHCAACGYNLTGNVSGVCPECGAPIATRR